MEDFVTFEIAVKLKGKGFKEKCLAYYDEEDNVGLLYNTQYTDEALPCQYTDLLQCHNTDEAETQPDDSENCVDAPTISQVLKWLREEKKIFVEISCIYTDYFPTIRLLDYHQTDYIRGDIIYSTYEKAALAGIEYVLDYLL